MNLEELLQNADTLEQIAKQFGIDSNQASQIIKNAVPEISNSINENTSSKDGLKSFWKALEDHQKDPVDDMLTDPNKVDTTDGDKILGHIFGEKKQNIEENISQKQGVPASSVNGILKYLAPIIMAMLAKQALSKKPARAQTNTQAPSNNPDILESMLGKESSVTKMAKSFLDKNKDGSILDDILGNLF